MMLRDDELAFNDGSPDIGVLYAWTIRDEAGIEDIVAMPTRKGLVPLICADEQRAMKLRDWAQIVANGRRERAALVRFTRAEMIAQVNP